jgi:hypothetical protein
VGFSDSDHAGDVDSRRSTSGVLFFLGKNLITWQSQKQKVVALSSCEAEYIAGTTAACQGIWLARLIAELRGKKTDTANLKIDNQSAIALSHNPGLPRPQQAHRRQVPFHSGVRRGWQSEDRVHQDRGAAGRHRNQGSGAGTLL